MPFRAIIHSMILQAAGALTLSALLMFLPAGTFAWPQGWLFLALFFGLSQAMGLWLLRTDPALLAARMSGVEPRVDVAAPFRTSPPPPAPRRCAGLKNSCMFGSAPRASSRLTISKPFVVLMGSIDARPPSTRLR